MPSNDGSHHNWRHAGGVENFYQPYEAGFLKIWSLKLYGKEFSELVWDTETKPQRIVTRHYQREICPEPEHPRITCAQLGYLFGLDIYNDRLCNYCGTIVLYPAWRSININTERIQTSVFSQQLNGHSCYDPKMNQLPAPQNSWKEKLCDLFDAPCRRCLACGFCTLAMKGSTLSKNVAILPASKKTWHSENSFIPW